MRAALIVNRVTADTDASLAAIVSAAEQAADRGADLILFPEAAVTGLINNDDPAHDRPLAQTIPGPITDRLVELTHRRGIYLAIGILEREGDVLYDSAVLLAPDGSIALHYRRIQPNWHGRKADPAVYRQGHALPAADTPLGRFTITICGDLFDDGVICRVQAARPDWLLYPMARCFGEETQDQASWEEAGRPMYLAQIRQAGCITLMANYLADGDLGGGFGGAFAASARGEVMASLPLGCEGTLLVDLPSPVR